LISLRGKLIVNSIKKMEEFLMNNQNYDQKNQEDARKKFSAEANDIKEKAKEGLESAKNKGGKLLEEAGEQVKEYASEAKSALTHCVEKNPLAAVGIAALAGMGLALILFR